MLSEFVLSFLALSGTVVANSPVLGPQRPDKLVQCLTRSNLQPILPSSSGYSTATQALNLRTPYFPAAVVRPKTSKEVSSAVKCAASLGVKVAAKAGGHAYTGFSLGGRNGSLVVDLVNFNGLEWIGKGDRSRLKVGAGQRLGPVALKLDERKRGIPHGVCPSVGVGGHVTHGGFGFTSRKWGVALDAVKEMEVVLADGSIKTVSEKKDSDLFWAFRGAGDSFGIVTSFTFETYEQPATAIYFNYTFPTSTSTPDRIDLFTKWQTFAQGAPANMALRLWMVIDAANPVDSSQLFVFSGAYWGPRKEFNAAIAPLLASFPKDIKETVIETSYLGVLSEVANHEDFDVQLPDNVLPSSVFYTKSVTAPEPFTNKTISSFINFLSSSDANMPTATSAGAPVVWYVILDLYGGKHSKISQLPLSSAAYDGRDALYTLQLFSTTWTFAPPYPDSGYAFMDKMVASITEAQPETNFGAYINYVDDRYTAKEAHELYYGAQYPRLTKIKQKWDPKGIFWNPYAVGVDDKKHRA